jgi:pilus assembly protein Flp/PilA
MRFLTILKDFHAEESGQDLVEYALVLAAMAFAVVAGSGSVANVMANALIAIATKISGAIASIS